MTNWVNCKPIPVCPTTPTMIPAAPQAAEIGSAIKAPFFMPAINLVSPIRLCLRKAAVTKIAAQPATPTNNGE